MASKVYGIVYFNKIRGTWVNFGGEFESESKAKKFAEDLQRDYPNITGDYFITWEMK